jgi:hypothetical protein
MSKKKREPLKIAAFVLSVLFIVFMWCKKDITSIYASVSVEDALPIIITTIGVALLKTLSLAAIIILIKWLISKFLNTRKGNSYE